MQTQPWCHAVDSIVPEVRDYCTIRHLPFSGDALRVAVVDLVQETAGAVIKHAKTTEVVYVERGTILSYVDGRVSRVDAGSVICIPPGIAHGFKPLDGGARLIVVHGPAVPASQDHERIGQDFDVVTGLLAVERR